MIPAQTQRDVAAREDEEGDRARAADVDADDHGLPPDAVGQPAGDERPGDAGREQHAVHEADGRRCRARAPGRGTAARRCSGRRGRAIPRRARPRGTASAGSRSCEHAADRAGARGSRPRRGRPRRPASLHRDEDRDADDEGGDAEPERPRRASRRGRWSSAAANPTTTVPTLPPATWTAIALPSRLGGNCSASSALPTGCCGAPPIRETRFATANGGNELRGRLERGPDSGHQAAAAEHDLAADATGDRGERVLEQAARDAADGRQDHDGRRRRPRTRR